MTISNFIPDERLRAFIKEIKVIESGDIELENCLLPSTSLTLAFRIKGENSCATGAGKEVLPLVTVSGLHNSVRVIHYGKHTATLIVLFHEHAAGMFFNLPLNELFGQSIDLCEVFESSAVNAVEELIGRAKTNEERVSVVERFLSGRLAYDRTDQMVLAALSQIRASGGNTKIQALAQSLYTSTDVLEKRFRRAVGSSPKQFASIIRMDRIARAKPQGRMIDLALEAGFHDQAHFNKAFLQFTGQTPSMFFENGRFW